MWRICQSSNFPEDVDALVDSREAVRALAAALGNVDGAGSGTTLFVVLGTQQAGHWGRHNYGKSHF